MSKVKKFQDEYHEIHNRMPNEREIAKELGLAVTRIKEILESNTTMTSTSTAVGEEGDGMTLEDVIPDNNHVDGFDLLQQEENKEHIEFALSLLPEADRTLIEMRFGFDEDPKSLAEMGLLLGCDKSKVQKLESKIKKKLKTIIAEIRK